MNRPAALNRTLLALIGLALLAAGGLAIAAHLGKFPLLDPAAPLTPGTAPPPTWACYLAITAAVLLGLLALRWLVAQAQRRPKNVTWRTTGDTGATALNSATAAAPVAADVGSYAGVRSASAWLSGSWDAPALTLVVTTDRDADPASLQQRITEHALPRLRQTLDVSHLPVRLEIRLTAKSGSRAR